MALIKQKTSPNHQTGDYWIIARREYSRERNTLQVILQCYTSKAARLEDKAAGLWYPTSMYFTFLFNGDHPLSEIDGDAINPDLITNPQDIETHMLYLHIMAIAQAAILKPENERTANEAAAAWFADAVNDV